MNPQTQPDQGNQTDEGVSPAHVEARRFLDRAAEHLARTPVMDTGARASVCAQIGAGYAVLAQVEASGSVLRFDGDLDPELVSEAVRQLRRAEGEGASRG
jgi:hypothetical protein